MNFLITVVIFILILVVPVMIGARLVDADEKGFGYALRSVIIISLLTVAIDYFIPYEWVAFIIASAVSGLVLARVLGTTLLRGLAIGVIAMVLQNGIILVFVKLFFSE